VQNHDDIYCPRIKEPGIRDGIFGMDLSCLNIKH